MLQILNSSMIVCANLTKKVPLENIFSMANSIGFKYIQFSFVHEGINDDNPIINNSFLDKAKKIKNMASQHSISFPVIHGWLPSTTQAPEVLDIYLQIREMLNSQYLIIHPKDLINLKQIIGIVKNEELKEFILIENVAEPLFKMDYEDINLIINAGINFCFDTCHAMESGLDIEKMLIEYQKYIKVIHLSDFNGEGRHLPIGSNMINHGVISKISKEVTIVFEHKAKNPDEFFNRYSTSFNYFSRIISDSKNLS